MLSCALAAKIVSDSVFTELSSAPSLEKASADLDSILEQAQRATPDQYRAYSRLMSRMRSV